MFSFFDKAEFGRRQFVVFSGSKDIQGGQQYHADKKFDD
jgi:hypothetical protein